MTEVSMGLTLAVRPYLPYPVILEVYDVAKGQVLRHYELTPARAEIFAQRFAEDPEFLPMLQGMVPSDRERMAEEIRAAAKGVRAVNN